MKILITGTTSGFGMYAAQELAEKHEVVCWARDNFGDRENIGCGVHVIIHCAHNRASGDCNIDMIKELVRIPHRQIIFLSSIDVYQQFPSDYALSKIFSEAIVRSHFDNYLILRPAMMIGPTMRKNNVIKMLLREPLTLSAKSTVDCVDYENVLAVILRALARHGVNTRKLINITNGALKLKDLGERFGLSSVQYGNFTYRTPEVCSAADSERTIYVLRRAVESDWFKKRFLSAEL